MNKFNKIINGKGWSFLGLAISSSFLLLYWMISGVELPPLELWGIVNFMFLFVSIGTYDLFTFFKNKERSFLIKKKIKSSAPRYLTFMKKHKLAMEVTLNKTMLYRTNKLKHTNRLFGFSSGWHSKLSSASFKWKPSDDGKKIEVWCEAIDKGLLRANIIGSFYPGTKLHLTIMDVGVEYVFTVTDTKDYKNVVEIDCEYRKPLMRYVMFPSFGGGMKSPRNTIFKMRRI